MIGPLKINIHSAKLERDTEAFGQMDPYLKLFIDGKLVKQTAKLDGAGKTPEWNEEIEYIVKNMT